MQKLQLTSCGILCAVRVYFLLEIKLRKGPCFLLALNVNLQLPVRRQYIKSTINYNLSV